MIHWWDSLGGFKQFFACFVYSIHLDFQSFEGVDSGKRVILCDWLPWKQYGQMKKQRWEESRRRRKEVRRSEKRKREKKEDAGARKGRKVAIHCVFPMICGSGRSKSKLAKAAGAEQTGRMRDEKLHAAVAQSTCPSQNVQNTPGLDHFWKLRCRKSARRCGAKHISKSKCTSTMFGPFLEIEMSKKVHAVVAARSTFLSQKFRCRFCVAGARDCAHCQKVSKTWRFCGSFSYNYNYNTLHYIKLHYTTLHYITLLYSTLLHFYNTSRTAQGGGGSFRIGNL